MSWVRYDHSDPLDEWLETHRPSKTSKRETQVYWITVSSLKYKYDEPREEDRRGLSKEWNEIIATNPPSIAINVDTMKELACKYKFTSGKWLIYVKTGEAVDKAWRSIVDGIVNGNLGLVVSSAKVSSHNPPNVHVICVYTHDFTDEGKAREAEAELKNLSITKAMCYKPDMYTFLNLYAKNKWSLKMSVYESKVVK